MSNFLSVINKFYSPGSDLYNLLLNHSQCVMTLAIDIAASRCLAVDYELLASGAMLHDVGIVHTHAPSILCTGSENYMRHGVLGAEMLRPLGLEAEARICERHIGAGLLACEIAAQKLPLPQVDFLPLTLEEKLVCYADNFFSKSSPSFTPRKFAEVRRKMAKFGDATLARFDEMAQMFGSPDDI